MLRRIRALRMEIARVRSQREKTEKQLKEKTFSGSEVQRSVEKLQEEVKVNHNSCPLCCLAKIPLGCLLFFLLTESEEIIHDILSTRHVYVDLIVYYCSLTTYRPQ